MKKALLLGTLLCCAATEDLSIPNPQPRSRLLHNDPGLWNRQSSSRPLHLRADARLEQFCQYW